MARRPHDHRHASRSTVAFVLVALLLVAAIVAAACSAEATTNASTNAQPSPEGRSKTRGVDAVGTTNADDWTHVREVVASLNAYPPTDPVVVLLGGSAARECVISDSSWSLQILARNGPATQAYDLGSRNRTMAQNVALVQQLPEGVRTIVLIGVNVGAFTSPQKTATVTLPSPAPSPGALSPYKQHAYSQNRILSRGNKIMLLDKWLLDRYPVFKRNYRTGASVLAKLIDVCKQRGFKPVLFELPRNTDVIGHQLDKPVARYRATCKALADKKHIPFISLIRAADIPNRYFYDLWHLVEPGRKIWQRLLTVKTVKLLEKYGYGDTSG